MRPRLPLDQVRALLDLSDDRAGTCAGIDRLANLQALQRELQAAVSCWAHKPPKPSDFFRAMESEAGEDLSWWWRGWYFNDWQLDLAVKEIAYIDGDPARGALVAVDSRDRLMMPATLRMSLADGTSRDVALPAETWIRQAATPIRVPTAKRITAATIDPDHRLPDRDPANNRLAGRATN